MNEEEIFVSVPFPAGGVASLLGSLVGRSVEGIRDGRYASKPTNNGGQSLQERSQQTSKASGQVLPNLISFFSSFLQ